MEKLLCAFLLVAKGFDTVAELKEWARKVRLESATAVEQGSSWKPSESWGTHKKVSLLYAPIQRAIAGGLIKVGDLRVQNSIEQVLLPRLIGRARERNPCKIRIFDSDFA